jgi:hypothetical protein
MTREDVLTQLRIGPGINEDVSEEYNDAVNAAIKALEQEPILDKIRAEIEKTTSRYTISREHGAMGQVEWSDRLIKESEVLEIIDKYKAESRE